MEEIDSTDKSPTQRVGRKQSSLHGDFSTLSLTPKRLPEQSSSLSTPPTPMIRKKCHRRRRIFMGTTAGSPVCGALFASSAVAVDNDERNTGEKTPTPTPMVRKRVPEQPSSPSTPPTPMVHKKRRRIFMGTGTGRPVCRALFA